MYRFKCSICQKKMDMQISTKTLNDERFCEKCGGKLVRIRTPFRIRIKSRRVEP